MEHKTTFVFGIIFGLIISIFCFNISGHIIEVEQFITFDEVCFMPSIIHYSCFQISMFDKYYILKILGVFLLRIILTLFLIKLIIKVFENFKNQ